MGIGVLGILSVWHIAANQIRMAKIKKIKFETQKIRTIFFEDKLCSSAITGQFIMFWIPNKDEIPLSLSFVHNNLSSVTVKEVGEASKAIINMKKGNLFGVRGPFGNHFKIIGKEALVIGGGIGIAPLMMLIKQLRDKEINITIIEGAKTKSEILFLEELKSFSTKENIETYFTTDDGSYGFQGVVTDLAKKILLAKKIDSVYTCGSEAMIREIYFLVKNFDIPLQASLERLMLCAMGICGSCTIGKYRVCKDGPVFDQTKLREVEKELGKFKRGLSGEKLVF
jgi:dihydroorotate dehydrogenase electron transfer subunit